jgi:hypothetical protein
MSELARHAAVQSLLDAAAAGEHIDDGGSDDGARNRSIAGPDGRGRDVARPAHEPGGLALETGAARAHVGPLYGSVGQPASGGGWTARQGQRGAPSPARPPGDALGFGGVWATPPSGVPPPGFAWTRAVDPQTGKPVWAAIPVPGGAALPAMLPLGVYPMGWAGWGAYNPAAMGGVPPFSTTGPSPAGHAPPGQCGWCAGGGGGATGGGSARRLRGGSSMTPWRPSAAFAQGGTITASTEP